MSKGKHVIEYNLRAQTPGSYHVLPAFLEPMYQPDIHANPVNPAWRCANDPRSDTRLAGFRRTGRHSRVDDWTHSSFSKTGSRTCVICDEP